VSKLIAAGELAAGAMPAPVAAVSVGIWQGQGILDLCYEEDSAAQVDLNVVMDGNGRFIEVQGTAEKQTFTRAQLDGMLRLAEQGITTLLEQQQRVLQEQTLAD
jgi:ribonuclease PH